MAFERIEGFEGKIHIPDQKGPQKHYCSDCYFCQMCSDERCKLCLKSKTRNKTRDCESFELSHPTVLTD